MEDYSNNKIYRCPNCGAPVVSEVCQYCGALTGLDTNNADMMYPSVDVKVINFNFWSTTFPLIFAIGFGFFGFGFPMIFNSMEVESEFPVRLFCIPFALISIGAAYLIIRLIVRNIIVSIKGREIIGTIYGYMDDNVLYNGSPGQKVKILVSTENGKKFLLYKLNSPDRPYPVNSKIKLKVHKDICKIYRQDI